MPLTRLDTSFEHPDWIFEQDNGPDRVIQQFNILKYEVLPD
jgi:hypothetical protein